MAGGRYDSSLTRVQPVFRQLHRNDPTGTTWLGRLLAQGSRAPKVLGPRPEPSWPGRLLSPPRPLGPTEQELRAPPPLDYLRWLVCHAQRMEWPLREGQRVAYGRETTAKRERLLAGDAPIREEALERLVAGYADQVWWCFEARTCVDCFLQSEQVTLFVEGKRTEPHLTTRTEWDPRRHQVFRNLDCLRVLPERRAQFYVLLVVEDDGPTHQEARDLDGKYEVARDSWPHLDDTQAAELWSHYLGFTTWQELARMFNLTLPHTRDEAYGL